MPFSRTAFFLQNAHPLQARARFSRLGPLKIDKVHPRAPPEHPKSGRGPPKGVPRAPLKTHGRAKTLQVHPEGGPRRPRGEPKGTQNGPPKAPKGPFDPLYTRNCRKNQKNVAFILETIVKKQNEAPPRGSQKGPKMGG